MVAKPYTFLTSWILRAMTLWISLEHLRVETHPSVPATSEFNEATVNGIHGPNASLCADTEMRWS